MLRWFFALCYLLLWFCFVPTNFTISMVTSCIAIRITGPCVRGIHRPSVVSPHNGPWCVTYCRVVGALKPHACSCNAFRFTSDIWTTNYMCVCARSNYIHIKLWDVITCHVITLTHWGRDKMDVIFQTTFWNGFSSMKMYEYRLKFHWSLFLRVMLTIFQHWFR